MVLIGKRAKFMAVSATPSDERDTRNNVVAVAFFLWVEAVVLISLVDYSGWSLAFLVSPPPFEKE
eukprot:9905237-Ditylum_brightwellii.AAC.1